MKNAARNSVVLIIAFMYACIASAIMRCEVKNIYGPKGTMTLIPSNAGTYDVMMSNTLNVYEATYEKFNVSAKKNTSNSFYTLEGKAGENTTFKLTLDSCMSCAELTIIFDDGSDDSERFDVPATCHWIGDI